ncbi:hypothetical protein GCM10011490_06070 [Pseudoclavibacter endophyticus]|nr:hypothetical protein GCM10011490_06070 [Pseudoclavibacter endophyticus]
MSTVTGMLGYCPSESLVLLPLTGRVGGAILRFDLPARDIMLPRDDLDSWVNLALGLALHVDDITAIAAIVFADEQIAAPPRTELVGALARGADRTGLRLVVPLFRAQNAWGRYNATASVDEPLLRSLDELGDAGRMQLTQPPREVVDRGDAETMRLTKSARRVERGESADALLDRMLARESSEIHPDDVEMLCSTVAEAAAVPHAQDHLLARIAFGRPSGAAVRRSAASGLRGGGWEAHQAHGGGPGAGSETAVESYEHGLLYDAFDPDRCERALPLLRAIVRRSDPPLRAGLLAVIAWTHWALGHGSLAGGYADQALAAAPSLELAHEVRMLVDGGTVAPWFGKPPQRCTPEPVALDDVGSGGERPASSHKRGRIGRSAERDSNDLHGFDAA